MYERTESNHKDIIQRNIISYHKYAYSHSYLLDRKPHDDWLSVCDAVITTQTWTSVIITLTEMTPIAVMQAAATNRFQPNSIALNRLLWLVSCLLHANGTKFRHFAKADRKQCVINKEHKTLKSGFHYPSWPPELMARVDGWPVSITRQHGPCWRARVSTSRVDGPCWITRQLGPSTRVVETGLYFLRAGSKDILMLSTAG